MEFFKIPTGKIIMTTVFDVDPHELIKRAAEELKKDKHITAPEWTIFVKTGAHKRRQPYNSDWWHIRAAAVLRTVYISKRPIGVSKIRTKYGGKNYRGVCPDHFVKGSGSIARKILQQLQSAGYIAMKDKGVSKGRIIAGRGKKLLDGVAHKIAPVKPKPAVVESKVSDNAVKTGENTAKTDAVKNEAKIESKETEKQKTENSEE